MPETRRMRPLMGTFVEVGVAGLGARSQKVIDTAFSRIEAIARLLSFQDPCSELSRLNARPGEWHELSADSFWVLRLARSMTLASGNRFNCTVGGQLITWGLLPDHCGQARIDAGCAADIELRSGAARLRRPVRVTLDGIAKGYAVDCAITLLQQQGAKHGWVNAGGDLRVFGPRRLPILRRCANGGLRELIELHRAALASSRTGAENSTDFPGRLVGSTGEVADGADIHVMARQAWRADALTKVAAACRSDERVEILGKLGGTLVVEPLPCAA